MTDTLHPSSQPNTVHSVYTDAGLIVRLVGDIDMSSWARLDQVYADVVAAGPAPVTVDLSDATFVDSTTLGFLARLHQHVTSNGHALLVESPTRVVSRAIEICGLDRVLTIRPTEGTA